MSDTLKREDSLSPLVFVEATYMGSNLDHGYKTGRRYPIAFRRDAGEVHIMHVPTAKVQIVYRSQALFEEDWRNIVEAPPFPKGR
jgi:hypothetical protein